MSLSSLFSSVFSVVHADAPEDKEAQEPQEESKEEEPQEEEEEEEEPEDVSVEVPSLAVDVVDAWAKLTNMLRAQALPALQEECQESAKCAPLAKHFAHCEEKVNAGEGFKGEDCIEEL